MSRSNPLTLRRLNAIEEALSSRMADERDTQDDPEAPTDGDYEGAYAWVSAEITKREARR